MRATTLILVPAIVMGTDVCRKYCDDHPGSCGKDKSYCKNKHACHDLFWTDIHHTSACHSRAPGCTRDYPVYCSHLEEAAKPAASKPTKKSVAGKVEAAGSSATGSSKNGKPTKQVENPSAKISGISDDKGHSRAIKAPALDEALKAASSMPKPPKKKISSTEDEDLKRALAASLVDPPKPRKAFGKSLSMTNKKNHPVTDDDYEAAWARSLADVHEAPVSDQVMRPGYPRMHNMGATCFVASAVQLLSHSRLLREALRTPLENPNPVAQEFADLMRQIWSLPTPDTQPIIPARLVEVLGFSPVHMEDTQEAMIRIIQALSASSERIARLFAVGLETRSHCDICKSVVERPENTNVVFVPVAASEGSPVTLEDCLFAAFSREHIHEYACETCGGYTNAMLDNDLTGTGDIIVVALRRFVLANPKITTPVEYPSNLVLPYGEYRLIGVANHRGETRNSGHYTAHVFHDIDGVWMNANDSVLENIRAPALSSSDAYVLLYERRA